MNISSSAARVIGLEKKTNQGKLIGTREFHKVYVVYSYLCLNSWPTNHRQFDHNFILS